MRYANIEDMTNGWFVGDFEPSILRSSEFEVSVKKYSAGDSEDSHVHLIATEITMIVSGRVKMAGRQFESGEIIMLEPGESSDFQALEETVTVVVKTPSVIGDKYFEGETS